MHASRVTPIPIWRVVQRVGNTPVEDFLFTYYTQKPGQLQRWHPGDGVVLSGQRALERVTWKFYRALDDAELASVGAGSRHACGHL